MSEAARRSYLQQLANSLAAGSTEGAQGDLGGSSAGESAWNTFKTVGSNALKALSVPQAALATTVAKAGGRDLSWKAALGDFRKDAEGRVGWQSALNSMGVTNRWAQFGLGIVADPLWLVGGGLARTAGKGVQFGKLGRVKPSGDGYVSSAQKLLNRLDDEKVAKNFDVQKKVRMLERDAARYGKPLEEIFELDKWGRIKSVESALNAVSNASRQLATREGLSYALKLGVGNKSVRFKLPKSAEKVLIGNRNAKKGQLKAGRINMKPVEKAAHATRRSAEESKATASEAVLRMAQHYNITEQDATILGVYRAIRSLDKKAGDELRAELKAAGEWKRGWDALTKHLDERTVETGLQMGYRTVHRGEFHIKIQKLEQEIIKRLDKNPDADIKDLVEQIVDLQRRGLYTRQGARAEDLKEVTEHWKKMVRQGRLAPGGKSLQTRSEEEILGARKHFDNPFATTTAEEFVADLKRVGLSDDEARAFARFIDAGLKSRNLDGFLDVSPEITGRLRPEWNVMILAESQEHALITASLDRQIDHLIDLAGLRAPQGKESELYNAVMYGNRMGADAASLSGTAVGSHLVEATRHLKGWFTFANTIPHYVTNLYGDWMNRLITGNMRHALPGGAAMPGSDVRAIANAGIFRGQGRVNEEALDKLYTIGKGRQMSGRELVALSRMSGMGTGYVGTDLALMTDVFERGDHPGQSVWRGLQRFQIKRENAQRVDTWIRHIKAGDDPMTAAGKMLRVHFDYSELTDFEKVWMRNMLLFYTWVKRNAMLQAQGMAERPGLYNAVFANMERTRQKFENEPEYYSKQGAIPVPFLGNLALGAPWGDIHRWELSWEGFRKEVIGTVNPFARVPIELGGNFKAFTGGRIQDYEGERQPSVFAQLFDKVPGVAQAFNVGPTTAKAGGESTTGMTPWAAYILSQFTGPQGSWAQATLSTPDDERENKWQDAIGRLFGYKPQLDRPEAFARAMKYIEAREKADETRRRNAQREAA